MFMEHAENRVIRTSSCIGCDRTTTRERTSLLINLAWPGAKAPAPLLVASFPPVWTSLFLPDSRQIAYRVSIFCFFLSCSREAQPRCVFVFFQFPITCSLVNIHGQKNIRIFYEYTICYRKELEISLDSLWDSTVMIILPKFGTNMKDPFVLYETVFHNNIYVWLYSYWYSTGLYRKHVSLVLVYFISDIPWTLSKQLKDDKHLWELSLSMLQFVFEGWSRILYLKESKSHSRGRCWVNAFNFPAGEQIDWRSVCSQAAAKFRDRDGATSLSNY